MDAKELAAALFSEYFKNETHVLQILETCYGGPSNWSSIEWTKEDSVPDSIPPGTGNLPTDGSPKEKTTEVIGMSIFWILLPLCLACVYHPLVSSIHNISQFRRYLHVSPIFCFIDSIYLIFQCRAVHAHGSITWRRAVEVVVKHRLRPFLSLSAFEPQSDNEMAELPTVEGNSATPETSSPASEQDSTVIEGPSETTTGSTLTVDISPSPSTPRALGGSLAPTSVVAQAALNAYVRLVANVGIILIYTRICGFNGIRPWSIIADLFFQSWIIMEVFLIVGYYVAPTESLDADDTLYYSVLIENSCAMTPSAEDTVLVPLFIEVLVSTVAVYIKIGLAPKVSSFCCDILGWVILEAGDYLVARPLPAAWDIPPPLSFPLIILALIPAILETVLVLCVLLFSFVALLATPFGYVVGLLILFGLVEMLLDRYNGNAGCVPAIKRNIIMARVLVAIICAHYVAYFVWLFDSEGTTKKAWTELLGRRLG
ncbi:hypothetical protein V8F20_005416 [Naviculisporaceae sp. PSN 640]